MAHPSKRKGNRFEREVVRAANEAGLDAERAYASNGRALGEAEGVDVVVDVPDGRIRIQAKRRKNVAAYLTPGDAVDAVVVREDRGDALAVLRLDALLSLLTAPEEDGTVTVEDVRAWLDTLDTRNA